MKSENLRGFCENCKQSKENLVNVLCVWWNEGTQDVSVNQLKVRMNISSESCYHWTNNKIAFNFKSTINYFKKPINAIDSY